MEYENGSVLEHRKNEGEKKEEDNLIEKTKLNPKGH